MRDAELSQFLETFASLKRVFSLRGDEAQQLVASYFKALRRFPVEAVQAGAEVWIRTGTKFPKPAEWIASIPSGGAPKDLRVLSAQEQTDYLRAERLRYEDQPCRCRDCQAAGVDEKPLRFVPDVDRDGRDIRVVCAGREVVAGTWIHGFALARWYEARANFYNRVVELGLRPDVLAPAEKRTKRAFVERLAAIYAPKGAA